MLFQMLLLLCLTGTPGERVLHLSFDPPRLGQALGYDAVFLESASRTARPGAPLLPVMQVDVPLSPDASNVEVRVLDTDRIDLPGTYRVLPCSRPLEIGQPGVIEEDPAIYGSDACYPATPAQVVGAWDLDGRRFATLAIHPVEHNPSSGRLRYCRSITVALTWQPGSSVPPPGESAGAEYVVISPDHWEEDWTALVHWKMRKGTPVEVVTLGGIEAQYAGVDTQEKIRAFIIDAYATWGARWFLLGGDTSLIPTRKTSVLGTQIPSDTYYADFDDDWKVEAFVGRVTADNSVERDTFIAKTLGYEKAPPPGFGASACFLAFDFDAQTASESLKKEISALYVGADLALSTEYDSDPGTHKADGLALLGAGFNLINHADHCEYNLLGLGSFRHDEHMTIQEVYGLANAGRAGMIKSIGCRAAMFDKNDCIAEHLCKAPGGGAAAFVGNSRSGWYTLGSMATYSALYDKRFFKALLQDGIHRVGETLAACKNAYYPTDDYYRYVFLELTLLGDPEMPLWTREPQAIEATHPAYIQPGGQLFTVRATSQGAPLKGASVCLWKGDEVYARGLTDAAGEWIANIHPLTPGDLLVTVTAENRIPFEGDAEVLGQGPEPLVEEVTPRCGLEAGGEKLTIEGSGFTPGLPVSVTLGGNPAQNVQVSGAGSLTCLAPPGTNGFVPVAVTTLHGAGQLADGYRYFPAGGLPFNGTDTPVAPVQAGRTVTLIASGQPLAPCLVFLSLKRGPTPTPWGDMGLGMPVYHLLSFTLGPEGYRLIPFLVPDIGPIELHVHLLGADRTGAPRWSYGGGGGSGEGEISLQIE